MKIYEFIDKRTIFTNKFDFFLNILFSKGSVQNHIWLCLTETGGGGVGLIQNFCLKPKNEQIFETVFLRCFFRLNIHQRSKL